MKDVRSSQSCGIFLHPPIIPFTALHNYSSRNDLVLNFKVN